MDIQRSGSRSPSISPEMEHRFVPTFQGQISSPNHSGIRKPLAVRQTNISMSPTEGKTQTVANEILYCYETLCPSPTKERLRQRRGKHTGQKRSASDSGDDRRVKQKTEHVPTPPSTPKSSQTPSTLSLFLGLDSRPPARLQQTPLHHLRTISSSSTDTPLPSPRPTTSTPSSFQPVSRLSVSTTTPRSEGLPSVRENLDEMELDSPRKN